MLSAAILVTQPKPDYTANKGENRFARLGLKTYCSPNENKCKEIYSSESF